MKVSDQKRELLNKLVNSLRLKNEELVPESRFTNEANVNEYLNLILTTAIHYLQQSLNLKFYKQRENQRKRKEGSIRPDFEILLER